MQSEIVMLGPKDRNTFFLSTDMVIFWSSHRKEVLTDIAVVFYEKIYAFTMKENSRNRKEDTKENRLKDIIQKGEFLDLKIDLCDCLPYMKPGQLWRGEEGRKM